MGVRTGCNDYIQNIKLERGKRITPYIFHTFKHIQNYVVYYILNASKSYNKTKALIFADDLFII